MFWNLAGIPGLLSSAAYFGSSTIAQALANAASFACIDVLADAIGRTPMDAMRGAGGRAVVLDPQPVALAHPSALTLKSAWRYQQAWSMVTDGNAFAAITDFDRAGWPTALELLDPTDVQNRQVVNAIPSVRVGGKVHELYPYGDVWHVPGRMVPAGTIFAVSPVNYAGKAIGTSLSVEDFSYKYFTEGAHPSALIYANTEITAEQAGLIKAAAKAAMTNSREPAVFGADLKYEQIQTNPSETQFIELAQFQIEQACRFWRVPTAMVYAAISGKNVTYANASQADLHFLKHTLDGYLVRLEEAWTEILPRPQYVRADRNSVLRMDVQGRYNAWATKLSMRAGTVNEFKIEEGEAPYGPEFDVPGIPPYPGSPEPTPMPDIPPAGNSQSSSADVESVVRFEPKFEFTVPSPVVNVAAPPPAQIHVTVPQGSTRTRKVVTRDADGRISGLVEVAVDG